MFDVHQFYLQAESGDIVAPEKVVQYISSFETIVLWGVETWESRWERF